MRDGDSGLTNFCVQNTRQQMTDQISANQMSFQNVSHKTGSAMNGLEGVFSWGESDVRPSNKCGCKYAYLVFDVCSWVATRWCLLPNRESIPQESGGSLANFVLFGCMKREVPVCACLSGANRATTKFMRSFVAVRLIAVFLNASDIWDEAAKSKQSLVFPSKLVALALCGKVF